MSNSCQMEEVLTLPEEVGRRVAFLLDSRGMKQVELVGRFNEERERHFKGDKGVSETSTFRISNIVNEKAAKIDDKEIQLLALALDVPPEILVPSKYLKSGVTWVMYSDEVKAKHVFELMHEYSSKATEFWGYAEFLPCSLETESFMQQHHRSIFADLFDGHREATIEKFDSVGNSFRHEAITMSSSRSYRFFHCMRFGDLEAIARGEGVYAGFSKELRVECFRNLHNLISNPANRITLYVAEDSSLSRISKYIRPFDSQVLIDNKLFVQRAHSGGMYFTTNPAVIEPHVQVFEIFAEQSKYRSDTDLDGVSILLFDMLKLARES